MREAENIRIPWILKVRDNGSTWLALASGFLILALVVVVSYEVWMRFVFREPTGWAVEIPRLIFLNILFLGLAYATKTEGHVSLDIITMRLSRRPKGLLIAITSSFALAISVILLWQSSNILVDSIREQWKTAALVTALEWPFYISMVIGAFAMCLEWLGKIAAGWRDFRASASSQLPSRV